MKLSDFDYELPKELIAQYPFKERDMCRLLVVNRQKGALEHRFFRDITDYLKPDDLLVLNNTKVLPSRLKGFRKSGGKVEILLLTRKEGLTFNALIKPARIRQGEQIIFNGGKIYAFLTARNELTFAADNIEEVYRLGVMPLPPYIKRQPQDEDFVDYQTIYAKENGAIASPTAGLHFTEELIERIQAAGAAIDYLTLHVGYSTFKPVKSFNIEEHKIEKEKFIIPARTIKTVHDVKQRNGRIFAVGTTTVRALETAQELITSYELPVTSYENSTNLFIYPGFDFKMVDCLITNFHLPKTTLFILACAFAGTEFIKKAYQEAVAQKYRFYSYGDAMLII